MLQRVQQKLNFGVQCRLAAFHVLKDREVQFFADITIEKFLCLGRILEAVVPFGLPAKVNIHNEILLVLMKLTLNCLCGCGAHRFGISSAQVGLIFRFWVPKMAQELGKLVWLPKTPYQLHCQCIQRPLPWHNVHHRFLRGLRCCELEALKREY